MEKGEAGQPGISRLKRRQDWSQGLRASHWPWNVSCKRERGGRQREGERELGKRQERPKRERKCKIEFGVDRSCVMGIREEV